jgi:microcystin-dependent protein
MDEFVSIGEIRMFAGDFVPNNHEWVLCNGAIMPRSNYAYLFGLIGNTFGGNGINTFAVPDFRGRLPVHVSGQEPAFKIGQTGGEVANKLTIQQLPPHTHDVSISKIRCNSAVSGADSGYPTNKYPAYSKKDACYTKTLSHPDFAGDPKTAVASAVNFKT